MCLLSVQLFLNLLLRGNVNFRRVGSVCSPQCLPLWSECCRRLDILNKRVGLDERGKLFCPRQHFVTGSHPIICYIFSRETKPTGLLMLLRLAVVQKPFQFYVTRYSSAHLSDTLLELGSSKVVEAWRGIKWLPNWGRILRGAAGLKNWDWDRGSPSLHSFPSSFRVAFDSDLTFPSDDGPETFLPAW